LPDFRQTIPQTGKSPAELKQENLGLFLEQENPPAIFGTGKSPGHIK